jgi:hypothetical protein
MNVSPGIVWTSTTALTAANLNLAAQPTVSIGTGEVTPSNMAASGIGYAAAGSGGTVTQATSKSTGVTLNTACGAITMNNAALADATSVSFTVTNSLVASTDFPLAIHSSGGTAGAYDVRTNSVGTGSFKITVRNESGGSLSEAIVLTVFLFKGVTS